jgi:hypothetical protein
MGFKTSERQSHETRGARRSNGTFYNDHIKDQYEC